MKHVGLKNFEDVAQKSVFVLTSWHVSILQVVTFAVANRMIIMGLLHAAIASGFTTSHTTFNCNKVCKLSWYLEEPITPGSIGDKWTELDTYVLLTIWYIYSSLYFVM